MERRTILRRLGIATAGVAGLSGVTTARQPMPDGAFDHIDRTLDVSGYSGQVRLTELLTQAELARAGADAGLATKSVVIDEEQTTLDLATSSSCDCYIGCCENPDTCSSCCDSCYCDNCDEVKTA